jgi:hypothetical protein
MTIVRTITRLFRPDIGSGARVSLARNRAQLVELNFRGDELISRAFVVNGHRFANFSGGGTLQRS